MVQRNGSVRTRGQNDPTEPVRRGSGSSTQHQSGGPTMQSFMDSFLSPFVQCVAPPFQACVTPTQPWQPRQAREASPVTHPVTAPSYATHQFGENDILCGKGRSAICHTGNQRFREVVEANKATYATATKKHKLGLAHSIVELIHRANPPGRFLLRDVETGRWYDIGKTRSLEKTSQALREKPLKNPDKPLNSGEKTSNRANAKPSLVVPRHLRHIYQAPPPTEFRNPPHSQDVRGGHPGMYLYPIQSASSFEIISPCNSAVSDGIYPSSPIMTGMQAHSPVGALPARTPLDYNGSGHAPIRAISPQALPSSVYTTSSSKKSMSISPREAFSSPEDIFREKSPSWESPPVFGAPVPVDGYREVVSPSIVRRTRRQESGEDGQAALAAAAFLNLDEIE